MSNSRSDATKKSWEDPDVAAKRLDRRGVLVLEPYRSFENALKNKGISNNRVPSLRKQLREQGWLEHKGVLFLDPPFLARLGVSIPTSL